jgi:hypothetical protein
MKASRFRFRAWEKYRKFMSGPYDLTGCNRIEALHGCDYIAMQSTGLKDKNGKEIFEGDILTGGYEVRWNEWTWWMYSKQTSRSPIEARNMVIIGNIYENPELLK